MTRIGRGQHRIDLLEFHAIAHVLGRDPVELFSEVTAELARLDVAPAEQVRRSV